VKKDVVSSSDDFDDDYFDYYESGESEPIGALQKLDMNYV
jgi:hypothetical protein